MPKLLLLFISSAVVNNFVLARFLGNCPFLGVSKEIKTSLGMGVATTFVMVMSGIVTWLLNHYILIPFELEYMQTIVFILTIATLVQFVEMVMKKNTPALHRALGIFLPLITTNCAVLGLAVMAVRENYSFIETVVFALGGGVGFSLALALMAGIREDMKEDLIPEAFRGPAIALITAGIMAMAFMGFAGILPS